MKVTSVVLFAGMIGWAFVQPIPAAKAAQFKETVLHSFGVEPDGALPQSGLIDVKGTLYGTTKYNGSYGYGAVFSLDPSTGAEKVLYSFCGQPNCTDGADPVASLIDVKGTLYGTTELGGTANNGTAFSLNPSTGTEKTIYSFCSQPNCKDGASPVASLIYVKGTLYGTAELGGTANNGTIFSLEPRTGMEKALYSFCSQPNCTDGRLPYASVISVHGTLYGTTAYGGVSDLGTVFSLNPKTGTENVLHSFCGLPCSDGHSPQTGLVLVDGILYGTTEEGGTASGGGTVFSLDSITGAERVLYSFCSRAGCWDGATPLAGLIDVRGTLYGTTLQAGGYGGGTAFTIDLKTGAANVLYSFCAQQNCTDGANPQAGLLDVDGALFGTTGIGGSAAMGTVFVLKTR